MTDTPKLKPLMFRLAASAVLSMLAACSTTSPSPYSPQPEAARDPLKAQALTLEAADLLDRAGSLDKAADTKDIERHHTSLQRAETLLRHALTADLYHGPAHNNLGVVYLKQHKLYEAASEFEWARKLMPGHPDPRLNLALTLERAGRTDQALDTYRTALEVYPDHTPTLQALTRLQLRQSTPTPDTREHLQRIALQGTTPEWRDWAQRMLATHGPTIP